MKSFSTVRDTQRGTQSYMEKRRGRREIEVTRRRRGGIKKGESKLVSNHFPIENKVMNTKLTNTLRGKERKRRKNRYANCGVGEDS